MLEKYKTLLAEFYENYKSTGKRCVLKYYENLTQTDKSDFFEACDFLEHQGYIKTEKYLGSYECELTTDGISCVENDYKEPQQSSFIQGDNNIYVQGSNNSISNNYNQISAEIKNSDLPEDCKQLIESLLYDIRNAHISPDKKSERIKSFLTDMVSDTFSSTAVSGLTTLLTTLFNQIQL